VEEIFEKYKVLKDDYLVLKDGRQVFRIKALRDIHNHEIDVKAGDLGGYVASEGNLSQMGNSWIGPGSIVCGRAFVSSEDVAVLGNSYVYDSYKHTCSSIGGKTVSIIDSYIKDCEFDIITEDEILIHNSKLTRCTFEHSALAKIDCSVLTDCKMSYATIFDSNIENAVIPYGADINHDDYVLVDSVPESLIVKFISGKPTPLPTRDKIFLCMGSLDHQFVMTSQVYKHDGSVDDLIFKIQNGTSVECTKQEQKRRCIKANIYSGMINSLSNMILLNTSDIESPVNTKKFPLYEYTSIINIPLCEYQSTNKEME
jgi:hypothetical protein